MGRNITTTAAAVHEPLAVTITGDAVSSGDYVRVEASGAGRRAVDGLSLATQNTAAGVTALAGLGPTAYVAAANYSAPSSGRLLAALGNGNVACLHTGDGTTATTALTCRVYSPVKAPVVTIAVSAAASITAARVFKLTTANFAVVWAENNALKMAVYTNAGAVVQAAVAVAVTGSTGMVAWSAAVLVNGDLVLAYDKTASAGVFFQRFNSTGVLQGAETAIEAAVAGTSFCVLPLAGGGWWVYYRNTTSTIYKFARYSAAGVLQGALTTVFAGAANLGGGLTENYAIELSNGNVALVDPSVGTVSAVRLYDSAGTLLMTVTNNTGLAAGAPNNTLIRAKSGGGFYVATFSGRIACYDNAGTLLIVSATTIPLGAGGTLGMVLDRLATGPLIYYATYDGSSVGGVAAVALDGGMVAEATPLTIQATTSISSGLWAEIMPSGLMAHAFASAQIIGIAAHGRLSPQAASVLGLAITAGTDGQAVSVATAGRWRANQTMPAVSFDRRSSAPVGCKAVITGGTSAVLLGIVA